MVHAAVLLLLLVAPPALATFSPLDLGGRSSLFHADSVGRVQRFSLPVFLKTCRGGWHSTALGFGKCMEHPDGSQTWRVALQWLNNPFSAPGDGDGDGAGKDGEFQANHFTGFGLPPDCELPSFSLATGTQMPQQRLPFEVRKPGGYEATALSLVVPANGTGGQVSLHVADVSAYFWNFHSECVPEPQQPAAAAAAAGGGGGEAQHGFPVSNYVLLAAPLGGPREDLDAPVNLTLFAAVLAANVAHHVHTVGFSGVIVNLRKQHLAPLTHHSDIRHHMQNGLLKFVLWAEAPLVSGVRGELQMLHVNHGFLAAWGYGLGILSMDADEFLVVADPGGLKGAWASCWRGQPAVGIMRFNTFCDSCRAPGGGADPAGKNGTEGDAFLADMGALDLFTLVAGREKTAPDVIDLDKAWAVADRVFPATVHGVYLAEDDELLDHYAPTNCSAILHLLNAFAPRTAPLPGSEKTLDQKTLQLAPWKGRLDL